MIHSTLLSMALLLSLAGSPAHAGMLDEDVDWHRQREAAAESNFQEIMQANEAPAPAAKPMDSLGYVESTVDGTAASTTLPAVPPPPGADPAQVQVALARWEAARQALQEAARAEDLLPEHLVVLGASTYEGRAVSGEGQGGDALHLRLTLQATLYGEGLWKTVPLVGEEVVIVSASAGGRPVSLSTRSGYHVWVTDQQGEVSVTLDLLVPSRGRKGSLEYEFLAARTPVTQFQCDFPAAGLEPRLRGAVQADVTPSGGGTRLSALLAPTSRVHLVGFKDMGQDDGRQARVYAESMSLLSLDEGSQELFTVIRYNILYAGQRQFDVALPRGTSLVSADGEGAFRYTVQPGPDGEVLRGETAYPISGAYELSLRLRRQVEEGQAAGEPFVLGLPRSLGVEREYGWLAAEVTGTLKVEEVAHEGALAVDARQLPWEMVQSAVSPILLAWRTHDADATVSLRTTALPDVEPQGASVDRIVADTVLSAEGQELTDLRITLRNRLRHSLRLSLPEGAQVRSALLDGQPIKPSLAADGALLLPLRRSAPAAGGLQPFTIQVVLERAAGAPPVVGRLDLALPAVELPVSSLSWTAWLPARSQYSALRGEVEAQVQAGEGQWFQPAWPAGGEGTGGGEGSAGTGGLLAGGQGAAEGGTMPVKIEVPRSGTALSLNRYWVPAGEAVTATTWHARGWLRAPLALLSAGLLALGLVQAAAPGPRRLPRAALGALLALAATVLAGPGLTLLAVLAGLSTIALRQGLHRALVPALRAWWTQPRGESAWARRGVLDRLGLVMASGLVGLVGLVALLRWISLAGSPL